MKRLKLNLVVAYAVLFAIAYQCMGLSADVSLATVKAITSSSL
jgi:hypothetical protein